MDEIHGELVEQHIVEPVAPPDMFDPRVQLAAAMTMCYYAGTPFMVPALVLPFVHIMFAVPKPHSQKWRGVSGLSLFNTHVVPRHFRMEGINHLRGMLRPLDFLTVIRTDDGAACAHMPS